MSNKLPYYKRNYQITREHINLQENKSKLARITCPNEEISSLVLLPCVVYHSKEYSWTATAQLNPWLFLNSSLLAYNKGYYGLHLIGASSVSLIWC